MSDPGNEQENEQENAQEGMQEVQQDRLHDAPDDDTDQVNPDDKWMADLDEMEAMARKVGLAVVLEIGKSPGMTEAATLYVMQRVTQIISEHIALNMKHLVVREVFFLKQVANQQVEKQLRGEHAEMLPEEY